VTTRPSQQFRLLVAPGLTTRPVPAGFSQGRLVLRPGLDPPPTPCQPPEGGETQGRTTRTCPSHPRRMPLGDAPSIGPGGGRAWGPDQETIKAAGQANPDRGRGCGRMSREAFGHGFAVGVALGPLARLWGWEWGARSSD